MTAEKARNDVNALVVKAATQIGFAFNVDQAGFAERGAGGDTHGLSESVAADFEDAETVHLADSLSRNIHQKCAFFDHFANARLDQIMTLHFRAESLTYVRGANHGLIRRLRFVIRFARKIRNVHKTGGDFVPPPSPAHAVF